MLQLFQSPCKSACGFNNVTCPTYEGAVLLGVATPVESFIISQRIWDPQTTLLSSKLCPQSMAISQQFALWGGTGGTSATFPPPSTLIIGIVVLACTSTRFCWAMFEGNLSPMQMYYIKLQQATICKYIIGGIIACFLLLHLEHIHKIMKIYNNVLWD